MSENVFRHSGTVASTGIATQTLKKIETEVCTRLQALFSSPYAPPHVPELRYQVLIRRSCGRWVQTLAKIHYC